MCIYVYIYICRERERERVNWSRHASRKLFMVNWFLGEFVILWWVRRSLVSLSRGKDDVTSSTVSMGRDMQMTRMLVCNEACYSVLQCVAVCCSALQCVAVCCSVLQCDAVCCSATSRNAIDENVSARWSMMQYVALSSSSTVDMCHSVLHKHETKTRPLQPLAPNLMAHESVIFRWLSEFAKLDFQMTQ